MKIIQIKQIEDCFDGSSIYKYIFDTAWTHNSIQDLRKIGDLDYFPDFPRPFFRLRIYEGGQLKGIKDEDSCTIFFPKKGKEEIERLLQTYFNDKS